MATTKLHIVLETADEENDTPENDRSTQHTQILLICGSPEPKLQTLTFLTLFKVKYTCAFNNSELNTDTSQKLRNSHPGQYKPFRLLEAIAIVYPISHLEVSKGRPSAPSPCDGCCSHAATSSRSTGYPSSCRLGTSRPPPTY